MPIPPHVAPRLRVDRAAAKGRLPAALNATDAEVDAAFATVDQDALYDSARIIWTTQVWDRVSPINGVPAEHFLARDDVDEDGDDDIYLLLRDGKVVGFQPFEPGVEGFTRIPKGQGLARAGKHADEIAAENASAEVLARVEQHIRNSRQAT